MVKAYINTTGATRGAGTAYPSGAPEFTPGFICMLCRSLFVLLSFFFRPVLSVLLRYTDTVSSNYSNVRILKFIVCQNSGWLKSWQLLFNVCQKSGSCVVVGYIVVHFYLMVARGVVHVVVVVGYIVSHYY
jgi:hypothetical protein